jgi:hypothetical protein
LSRVSFAVGFATYVRLLASLSWRMTARVAGFTAVKKAAGLSNLHCGLKIRTIAEILGWSEEFFPAAQTERCEGRRNGWRCDRAMAPTAGASIAPSPCRDHSLDRVRPVI